jgi:hypothetical protein
VSIAFKKKDEKIFVAKIKSKKKDSSIAHETSGWVLGKGQLVKCGHTNNDQNSIQC